MSLEIEDQEQLIERTITNPSNNNSKLRENIQSFVAGGVGGVFSVLVGHPFDLIKVRCQSNQASGLLDAIRQIQNTASTAINNSASGPKRLINIAGFYKGVGPPLVGVTPIFAVSFWGYNLGKDVVEYFDNTKSYTTNYTLSTTQMAIAGFLSAIPTTAITTPIERVKVVMQTTHNNLSMFETAREMNIRSLFKGCIATFARDGPGSALYFASYEYTKNRLSKNDDKDAMNISNIMIAGGVAGIAMWLGVFPIDTIKTKLQASATTKNTPGTQTNSNIISVAKQIYTKNGGIRGFYPGLGPALLRAVPANAATFLGVELAHYLFKEFDL
ncbi:carnitine:acyl carnitine antiporter SCDLUD_002916 [Saccharomycodes ludwigii]|uniref:carnitine:acyl carnitine antiporter n=1 Tax=Saccharomycodes ludwigii TaxID=36035 RepID=UPI001E8716B6|nr:hypothetical protein SCDLUD_002916 [Saccharomycodes ludwigii]KAH3901424.1 hypothetical protein SCDLUD_002916 [Saccharomycodes ludwigii]